MKRSNVLGLGARWVVLAVGLVLCTLPAAASRNQVWFKGELEGAPIREGWAKDFLFKVEDQVKYDLGHDARIFDEEFLAMVGWAWSPYLSTFVGWKYANQQSTSSLRGSLRGESRPSIDIDLRAPEFWTLKFDARTRIEFRNKHGETAYMRYRERLRVRTGWSVTDFRFSPYASEEFFFEDTPHHRKSDTFNRSRTQLGLSFKPLPKLCPNVSCNAYYMVQHDMFHHDSWTPTNIYGLEFKYTF